VNQPHESALDWAALSAAWRGGAVATAQDLAVLRARIDRVTVRLRWWRALEACLSAAALAGTGWALVRNRTPFVVLFVVDTWCVLAAVWAFELWNRRGEWAPLAQDTEAYLALARQRAVQRLRSAWFGLVLLVLQVVVVAILPSPGGPRPAGSGAGRAVAGLGALLILAWAAWQRRRALEALAVLDQVQESLRSATD
jgi:hypothetical protein